jgi:hypothetical protein
VLCIIPDGPVAQVSGLLPYAENAELAAGIIRMQIMLKTTANPYPKNQSKE